MSDYIKVPGSPSKIVLSNDRETIAYGSEYHDYAQKCDTKNGKPLSEPMKSCEGEHILHEMERARLCGP